MKFFVVFVGIYTSEVLLVPQELSVHLAAKFLIVSTRNTMVYKNTEI
jgi:hypothetical protein